MEDEECLPENSTLKLYLHNLGFTDFPVIKTPSPNPWSLRFEVAKPETKSVETIDEDVVDQISIIISTQMLSEEDISKVEKLLSNFKVVKNGMLKSMFSNLFGVVVIFLGLCLFWVIGYYAFFIVSSFYAFTAAEYMSRKHFHKRRLKKLTCILHANFGLLKKTVKFIEENKSLEASICKNISDEFIEGFDFYNNFKSDFLVSINEMINILANSTRKLIIKIPLCDNIENPEFYLCNNLNKNYESLNVFNLYNMYLLVQSEFLQRLTLSLIPNIKISTKDNFSELNSILTEACVSLLKLKNKLNKKFKFLFLNGIYSSSSEIKFKLPYKHNSCNRYSNEFMLNIHEISKIFQKLLLQCRVLEEKITADKISEFVEEELVNMQQSLSACQKNISDSLILFKKLNCLKNISSTRKEVKIQDEKELSDSIEESNKVVVGYSDLDPKVEDEIFEACFNKENSATNLSDVDEWDAEERLIKKQKKEVCKNLMTELKVKLKEKAKNWKKREREALKKKGIYNGDEYEDETETSDEEKEVKDKSDNLFLQSTECQKIFNNCEPNIISEFKNFNDDVVETEIPECQELSENSRESQIYENCIESEIISSNLPKDSFNSELCCESYTPNIDKKFLDDLNQARQKIFKTCEMKEESFYASGEDSSSEDNHSL